MPSIPNDVISRLNKSCNVYLTGFVCSQLLEMIPAHGGFCSVSLQIPRGTLYDDLPVDLWSPSEAEAESETVTVTVNLLSELKMRHKILSAPVLVKIGEGANPRLLIWIDEKVELEIYAAHRAVGVRIRPIPSDPPKV